MRLLRQLPRSKPSRSSRRLPRFRPRERRCAAVPSLRLQAEASTAAAAPAPRRVIMPQTGPRPVYSAPPAPPPSPAVAPAASAVRSRRSAEWAGCDSARPADLPAKPSGWPPGFGQRPQGGQPYNAGAPGRSGVAVRCIRRAARRRVGLRGRVRRWVADGPVSRRVRASVATSRPWRRAVVWFRLRARLRVRKGRADRRVAVAAIGATRRAKKAR